MATLSATTRWSRSEIARRILSGDTLIVMDNHILRIPYSWLSSHPGGSAMILHHVGRDATDEINAYHCDDTLVWISKYSIGILDLEPDEIWENFVPPFQAGWIRKSTGDGTMGWHCEALASDPSVPTGLLVTNNGLSSGSPTLATITPPPSSLDLKEQAALSAAYRELHEQIKQKGLYQTHYIKGYGFDVARFILLGTLSFWFYSHNWLFLSSFLLGCLWHQVVFTVHDLGHISVTHNWEWDRLISIFLADFIGGISVSWWTDSHNAHHLLTNHPNHDPDIQHIPFFAISSVFFKNLWSTYYRRSMRFDRLSKMLISVQHKIFYLVIALARFNLYFLSYSHLIKRIINEEIKGNKRSKGGRWAFVAEVSGVILFWAWLGRVLYGCGSWQKALMYLLVCHITTSPLHVQILLSHFTMSTEDLGPRESFVQRQLRTTTDIACPPWLEFFHGGLQLQVPHHLFPRLPRHNLREVSLMVKAWAKEHELEYFEFRGFIHGNSVVQGLLKDVADQLKVMSMVVEGEVKEAITKSRTQRD